MAIVVRIVSADGKRTVMKVLPGLPSKIKVPAGAKVDVTEDGQTKSLAAYVNEHSHSGRDGGNDQVSTEPAQNWEEAEAWLTTMADLAKLQPASSDGDAWFTTAADADDSVVFGLGVETLLLGGVAIAGAGYGIYELTRNDSAPKDNTPLTAPTALDLATDDDTGASTSDNITSKTSGLTISGKAKAGATVELFAGTTSLGTATVGADGTFSKDVSLAEGEHSITAVAKDKGSSASPASAAIKVTVDTTAPGAATELDLAAQDDTGVSNSDNLTTKTSGLTISGNAEPGSKVELFDGQTSLGTATVGANGRFTMDISLSDGTHQITAKATDAAGNTGPASAALAIKVDTSLIPAKPTGLDLAAADDNGPSNSDNVTSKTSGLTISGTAPKNTTVELFDGDTSLGSVSVGADGRFSMDISLSGTGAHVITAKATDAYGVTSDASGPLSIVIAAAPPAPTGMDVAAEDDTGVSNSDNITSQTSHLTVGGSAQAGSMVELFDGTTSLGKVTAGSDGKFTIDISLAEGAHAITAVATNSADYAGPTSSVLNITVDTTAPAKPTGLDLAAQDDNGNSSSDNVTSNRSDLTISGTAEAGTTVELFNGAISLGTAVTRADGTFTKDIDLPLGTHEITAKASDAAGNASTVSTALEITVAASPAAATFAAEDHWASSHTGDMFELDHIALSASSSGFGFY